MARERDEEQVYRVALAALTKWLGAARDTVMAPWRRYKMNPDPSRIFATQPLWDGEVETILTVLGRIALGAWSEATNVPPVSRHSFIMAQLAQTQNLLVRIPDEVYNMVFAEIADGVNGGEPVERIAERVDAVLSVSGSEHWPNRARVIAQTETTRAYGAGTLAAGMEMSRVTGRLIRKRWDTERDARVRASHRSTDGQMRQLWEPFDVGGFPMQFPGDPIAPADEVVNCRCDLRITDEGSR